MSNSDDLSRLRIHDDDAQNSRQNLSDQSIYDILPNATSSVPSSPLINRRPSEQSLGKLPISVNGNMARCKCLCCASLLEFPTNVRSFRCTVCQSVCDLVIVPPFVVGENPPRSGSNDIEPLTLENLQNMCDAASATSDYSTLESRIKRIFSSYRLLNASFFAGVGPSESSCGVNLIHVRQAYSILLRQPPSILRALMASVHQLLQRLGRTTTHTTDLPLFMILLENPLLSRRSTHQEALYHHHLLLRIFGYISCMNNTLHHYLVLWMKMLPIELFRKRVDLVNQFISYRLVNVAAVSGVNIYQDWGLVAGAKTMALFYAANGKRSDRIHLEEFYNTAIDATDLMYDFDSWQRNETEFSFCQFPFLITMGSKMAIIEKDARRQMEKEIKEAIISAIYQRKVTIPFLSLRVRRDHLIIDSLNQISRKTSDLKKKLRIEFVGEEGIDAGGLAKEWFLLLVRDLFQPQYGMFTYDESSNLVWFNPAWFEGDEEYFLVGVVLGLAIYNSTILDIHFPLACYKKLLDYTVTFADLQQLHPTLAKGLQQLLDFDGDVESTFCRDFVGTYEAFGQTYTVPLIDGGENIPVTNDNREEFVRRYIDFIFNESITRQFDPFRRGFYLVCNGNALSLFRPEEIELLVHGSPDIDLGSLKAVTVYDGFRSDEPIITWLWDVVENFSPELQRKFLLFSTGSDRIPATGTVNLVFKVSCLGESVDRYPISHTCFNQLCLYRYKSRSELEIKLRTAIQESEGFALK